MRLLDGRAVAAAWKEDITQDVARLAEGGVVPGLAVVLVGDDPASVIYTTMKERASSGLGFHSVKETLPAEATTETVVALIDRLNADPRVHGILVQLPLPDQIDTDAVLSAINPAKDVDGLHPESLGRLLIGPIAARASAATGTPGLIPATPRGILRLLEHYEIPTTGRHVVIVGRSQILGKPLAALFLSRDATVTICHSKTTDLAGFTRQGDIVVMDTGVPGLLTGAMVGDGAVVIDAGITKDPSGRVVGDARFDELKERVSAITPVPGGVGPMTIAALLANTVDLARRLEVS